MNASRILRLNRIHPLKAAGLLVALNICHCGYSAMPPEYRGRPFDDVAYRAAQQAEGDRPALPFRAYTEASVVWNGKTATNGSGWVSKGEPGASVRLDEPDADGKQTIHFHATTPNYRYTAFGWQWATVSEESVDLGKFAAVSFSLKITGPKKMQELFFSMKEDQSAPVSIRPFQPSFADGAWHRVTIPFRASQWTSTSDKVEVRGFTLSTFVWNASDFDVFVDSVSFDRGAAPTSPPSPPMSTSGTPSTRGQAIPGRLECAFYDLGGEGVAYHDTTPMNTLSAVLNQQAIHQRPHATPYFWNFRREEGVDISYVKDFADLNHPNLAAPPINQLYIGGTEEGEWCNYTVEVKKAGAYSIIAAYGNIAGMKPLRFSIDGKPAAECPCPVVTGSMHKWAREEVGKMTFPEAGTHLLTLHYGRGYNLGYFEFAETN